MPLPPFATPSPEERLRATQRPEGAAAMLQRWEELLFLHWEVPAEEIQATLPEGLAVDRFEGRAYLGLVPFLMRGVRPRRVPPVPGVSDFLEMNLRTYVHDREGRPGVWFYSLDASRSLAVRLARALFHLPYFRATMGSARADRGSDPSFIAYRSHRRGTPEEEATSVCYRIGEPLPQPRPGSLEWFLIERYRLFAYDQRNSRLFSGRVHHRPYALAGAEVLSLAPSALAQAGFPIEGPPVHAVYSPGVEVEVFGLREAKGPLSG